MKVINSSKLIPQIEKQAHIFGITNISISSTSAREIQCTGNTLNSGQSEKFSVELTATGKVKSHSFRYEYRNEFVRDNND